VTIRFYLDADLLGVAKILADVRSDVTYAGHPGGLGLNRCCQDQPKPARPWVTTFLTGSRERLKLLS
jgi:hypothetical protein